MVILKGIVGVEKYFISFLKNSLYPIDTLCAVVYISTMGEREGYRILRNPCMLGNRIPKRVATRAPFFLLHFILNIEERDAD